MPVVEQESFFVNELILHESEQTGFDIEEFITPNVTEELLKHLDWMREERESWRHIAEYITALTIAGVDAELTEEDKNDWTSFNYLYLISGYNLFSIAATKRHVAPESTKTLMYENFINRKDWNIESVVRDALRLKFYGIDYDLTEAEQEAMRQKLVGIVRGSFILSTKLWDRSEYWILGIGDKLTESEIDQGKKELALHKDSKDWFRYTTLASQMRILTSDNPTVVDGRLTFPQNIKFLDEQSPLPELRLF